MRLRGHKKGGNVVGFDVALTSLTLTLTPLQQLPPRHSSVGTREGWGGEAAPSKKVTVSQECERPSLSAWFATPAPSRARHCTIIITIVIFNIITLIDSNS